MIHRWEPQPSPTDTDIEWAPIIALPDALGLITTTQATSYTTWLCVWWKLESTCVGKYSGHMPLLTRQLNTDGHILCIFTDNLSLADHGYFGPNDSHRACRSQLTAFILPATKTASVLVQNILGNAFGFLLYGTPNRRGMKSKYMLLKSINSST